MIGFARIVERNSSIATSTGSAWTVFTLKVACSVARHSSVITSTGIARASCRSDFLCFATNHNINSKVANIARVDHLVDSFIKANARNISSTTTPGGARANYSIGSVCRASCHSNCSPIAGSIWAEPSVYYERGVTVANSASVKRAADLAYSTTNHNSAHILTDSTGAKTAFDPMSLITSHGGIIDNHCRSITCDITAEKLFTPPPPPLWQKYHHHATPGIV
jgi:hypothetical protein